MKMTSIVKTWGHSLGVILPKEIVREGNLKAGDLVLIEIRKRQDLLLLFGTLRFARPSQAMKEESRALWNG